MKYVAPASIIDPISGTSLKSIAPLNVIVCSPGFNGFSRIQNLSETPVPLPAGIFTVLFATAVNSNPPAGESILYCSRFVLHIPRFLT